MENLIDKIELAKPDDFKINAKLDNKFLRLIWLAYKIVGSLDEEELEVNYEANPKEDEAPYRICIVRNGYTTYGTVECKNIKEAEECLKEIIQMYYKRMSWIQTDIMRAISQIDYWDFMYKFSKMERTTKS